MIIGIIAIARNFAIGRQGKLPWHYSADLKFFKATTTGNAIVMGANTWRSIGKPLPDRLNIVLSRSGNIDAPPEVMRLESRDEVVALAGLLNRDLYIIGGAKTYAEFGDCVEKWIITEIPETVEDADTFMTPGFLDDFEVAETRDLDEGLKVKIMRRR
jgi:dihydrofolate reductase